MFGETARQTVLCINKESCIWCCEIYKCDVSHAGDVIIQARLTRGEDEAFRTSLLLPLRKWIRLDCYIQDSKVQNSACSSGWQHAELGKKNYLRQHKTVFLSCEFAPVPLLCEVWGFCCNSCKILKDGPAGKCSLHSNFELFAAECFLYVCVYLISCIITCMSYSQVLLDVTWDADIHRYAYMYGIDFLVFLMHFLNKRQWKYHGKPLSL